MNLKSVAAIFCLIFLAFTVIPGCIKKSPPDFPVDQAKTRKAAANMKISGTETQDENMVIQINGIKKIITTTASDLAMDLKDLEEEQQDVKKKMKNLEFLPRQEREDEINRLSIIKANALNRIKSDIQKITIFSSDTAKQVNSIIFSSGTPYKQEINTTITSTQKKLDTQLKPQFINLKNFYNSQDKF